MSSFKPTCNNSFDIWHKRLAHPSKKIVQTVLHQCKVPYVNTDSFCSACCLGKIHKSPYFSSETKYTKPLELVHTDLWGPSPCHSASGYKYYIHFIDAYSRYTWIYLLRQKSDALATFKLFQKHVELQLGHKILAVQSDWGGEYRPFTGFLHSQGIVHRNSCPHSHQQNGLAERKHQQIVETGLTLLAQATMPIKFWDEAFRTAVFLINRLPTPLLHMATPLETLFHIKPSYTQLKVFDCECFPNTRPYNNHKLDFRSKPCIFLG